jgi:hypothetical protein
VHHNEHRPRRTGRCGRRLGGSTARIRRLQQGPDQLGGNAGEYEGGVFARMRDGEGNCEVDYGASGDHGDGGAGANVLRGREDASDAGVVSLFANELTEPVEQR